MTYVFSIYEVSGIKLCMQQLIMQINASNSPSRMFSHFTSTNLSLSSRACSWKNPGNNKKINLANDDKIRQGVGRNLTVIKVEDNK